MTRGRGSVKDSKTTSDYNNIDRFHSEDYHDIEDFRVRSIIDRCMPSLYENVDGNSRGTAEIKTRFSNETLEWPRENVIRALKEAREFSKTCQDISSIKDKKLRLSEETRGYIRLQGTGP